MFFVLIKTLVTSYQRRGLHRALLTIIYTIFVRPVFFLIFFSFFSLYSVVTSPELQSGAAGYTKSFVKFNKILINSDSGCSEHQLRQIQISTCWIQIFCRAVYRFYPGYTSTLYKPLD